jgi:ABC-type Mn2+/Zn2+ transport system permease subunit
VGVILSLGLLILPGATLYLFTDSFTVMAWGGGLLGVAAAIVGLWISYAFHIACGPAIVLVLGAAFLLAFVFSPHYGVWRRLAPPRHLHNESLARWKKAS